MHCFTKSGCFSMASPNEQKIMPNSPNDSLKVDYVGIIITGFVLIIPAIIGAYVRYKSAFWAKRLEKVGGALGAIFLLAAAAYGNLAG